MSASPKSKRTPPVRKFEDYVLTKEVGQNAGLFPIENAKMKYLVDGEDCQVLIGKPGEPRGNGEFVSAAVIDIGFDFQFDGINYRKLIIGERGIAVFVDPAYTSSSYIPVLSNPYFDALYDIVDPSFPNLDPSPSISSLFRALYSLYHNFLLADNFVGNHLVLMPWFSTSNNIIWRYITDSYVIGVPPTTTTITPELYLQSYNNSNYGIEEYKKGFSPLPKGVDSSLGGIKYAKGRDIDGDYAIIRWALFANTSYSNFIIKFDLVLRKSGEIEFRYAPKLIENLSNVAGQGHDASIGIFKGGKNYRDFSMLLKKDSTLAYPTGNNVDRGIYSNGGTVHKDTYSSKPVGTYVILTSYPSLIPKPYNVSLSPYEVWPGQEFRGCILKFSPPQNKRRQNRSITTIRDSVSFTNRDGSSLFNDQLALPPASSQLVEYPSMMPVSFRTSANYSDPVAINNLYSSGSIQVNRTFKPGLADSTLYDSLIEGRYRGK